MSLSIERRMQISETRPWSSHESNAGKRLLPELQDIKHVESVVLESAWREADCDLARRLAANGPGALDELMRNQGQHLRRLLGSLSGGFQDVDDLMQETLLKAWENAGSYRGEAPLKHWLTRIAVGVCRNQQRGSRRLLNHLRRLWSQHNSQQYTQPQVTSDDPRVEEMQRAMKRLSHSDRELLVLFHIERQPLESLASVLKIRLETLHVRLHRARQRLRGLLDDGTDT